MGCRDPFKIPGESKCLVRVPEKLADWELKRAELISLGAIVAKLTVIHRRGDAEVGRSDGMNVSYNPSITINATRGASG
jgi:hypothetical protein